MCIKITDNYKPRYHKGNICKDCGGKGRKGINIDGEEQLVDMHNNVYTVLCKTCNGRGWINVT